MKLPGRLAALAAPAPTIYARSSIQRRGLASASKTPARSLKPIALGGLRMKAQQGRAIFWIAGIMGSAKLMSCSSAQPRSAFTPSLDSLIASGAIDTVAQSSEFPTVAGQPQDEILRRWRAYLEAGKDNPSRACRPSAYWLPAEQKQWQCYALGMLYVPLRGTSQVVRIEQDGGSGRVYRVLTLFHSDTLNALRSSWTLLTVFAVHSDSGWLFANALPRFTADWPREQVGPFTYIRPPTQPFQQARAEAAMRFTDSLATLFSVPRAEPLTYYVMPTIDDVYRAMGLQTLRKWGPSGGVTQSMNHLLFSGDPVIGENYRHELVHIMLRPLARSPLAFVSESVPTWLGGTSGMDFHAAADSLATFLRNKPAVTLDSMVDGRYRAPVAYAAGAVFVQLLFEHGGLNAVKAFYSSNASGADLRVNMAHVFQQPWAVLAATWRSRALAFTATQPIRAAGGPPN